MTWRLLVGAALGACLVAFAVLAGLFTCDLVLSGQTVHHARWGRIRRAYPVRGCMARVQAAAGRLRWEIPALVVSGGLVGAAFARWRQHMIP